VTGNLNLGPAVRTFNIARGSAAADMMIAATISGGPGSGTALTKTGAGILVLSGANTYTGNTLVNQGTLSVAAGGSLASASVAVASGATLKVDGTLSPTTAVSATGNVVFPGNTTGAAVTRTAGALTIGAGVTVQLGASSYSKTPAILSLASLAFGDGTAKLDVSNDELITGGSTAANLRTVIVGSQLFSSAAGPGFGIGSIDVSGGKAEARFTLLGDANLDGAVDVGDLGVLATSYGITSSNIGWSQGDSNYSGGVDVGDLGSLATNYGSSLTTAPAVVSDASEAMVAPIAQALAEVSSPTAVPEPGCLGILATIGGVAASRKRRR
ncbi:MAG TPA: autotransporter-associated beta strand repeat-containing protein, partial [Tepidisphaeraceae bacterium]|nr:autotransporter-associated beta strand repeat-containing protein [Tepidisphaeraceae bacterium]